MAYYAPRLKKWGDTSPVSLTKLRPWSPALYWPRHPLQLRFLHEVHQI